MENIQLIPVVTEKANAMSEKEGRYTFKVSPLASKAQVKDAVEKLYDVQVINVNVMNYGGKNKQRYTKAGIIKGKTPAFKKAVVTLAEGQTIDFYSNI